MAFNDVYIRQVTLLLRTIPFIAKEPCFALKGGTAINLFIRDLPRLSVDIDLTYLPVLPRARSLGAIGKAMTRIAGRIEKGIKGAQAAKSLHEGAVTKLLVREGRVQIKIEVTPVLRGCAFEPESRVVSQAVEERFGFAEMQVVSFPDLYAGKIVAALDRQHPRDLFDIRGLLANEGVSGELRAAFIVYLLSHTRPMAEVLEARPKDIASAFARSFEGMTADPVSLGELLATRNSIAAAIIGGMSEVHRRFLVGFEAGEPDWSLLAIPKAHRLPAVKWRLENLAKLTTAKRMGLVHALETILGETPQARQLTPSDERGATKRTRKSAGRKGPKSV
jgi:predicted nucleotidyltransferase component of viral defense system